MTLVASQQQSHLAGDGNCFYRALLVAILEDLAVSTRRAKHRRLLTVIAHQKLLLTSWQGIDDAYYKHVRTGYHYFRLRGTAQISGAIRR